MFTGSDGIQEKSANKSQAVFVCVFFYVFLTMHLSIILVINQHNAQILFL